jgi:hypothetical protein
VISVLGETLVVFALGSIGTALYTTSRDLSKRPISEELVLVDLMLGFVAVWIVVLSLALSSKVLF